MIQAVKICHADKPLAPEDALTLAQEVENFLRSKGLWYMRCNVNQPDLKFIRFEEISIRVRQ